MIETDEIQQLADAAHKLATAGVDGLDGGALAQVALAARRVRELADHLEVHALGALDETGHTELTCGMSAAGWFAREAQLPTAVARSQVTVSRTLRRLPGTDQAWLDGRIGRDHVRVMCDAANPRIRDRIADAEDDLIALVDGRTFVHWRRAVGRVVDALDEDGPEPNDPARSTASWSRSGLLAELRATFSGVDVEVLEQAIEAKTDELYRRQARDRTHTTDITELTRNQLRAQAIIELILHGLGVDGGTAKAPRPLVTLVIRSDQPADGGPDLRPLTELTWTITNPNGHHLLAEHLGAVLCDCDLHSLIVDADDNPLKLGRTRRLASPVQRRAVLIRDGSCAFPGCDCSVGWLDIHHVRRYEDGGSTDVANLVALCRHHHGVTHRKGWSMHATGDGWFWWRTPTGHTFWSQRHGTQRAGPAPPGHQQTAAA